jgi:tRNA 2-thiouridine synthesizing protein A
LPRVSELDRVCSKAHFPAVRARNQPLVKEKAMNFDKELDARGLNCPLPILRTKKSLGDLTSGQVLKVSSTDPGSVKDMQAFAKQTGNELLSTAEVGGEFIFLMRKH